MLEDEGQEPSEIFVRIRRGGDPDFRRNLWRGGKLGAPLSHSSCGQIPMLSTSYPIGELNKRFSTYWMQTKHGEVWPADVRIAEDAPDPSSHGKILIRLPRTGVSFHFSRSPFSVVSGKSLAKW
jgi:hypothetical protein